MTYERDTKYNQLHAHAIVSMDKGARWRPYTKYRMDKNVTFRIHWNHFPPWDYINVLRYITKDEKKGPIQESIEASQERVSEYAKKNYMFDSDSD